MERLKKIGYIKPANSINVSSSRLGVGMEKLDRDSFDPQKVYDKVAALGVKWVRLQSGWQKTEKEEGIFDFSWLDAQVDNLLKRGLKPWLCLCYGNKIYDEPAEKYLGAVGCPPIRSEKAYKAWLSYVKATVLHFSGRIEYYEIWNEAEGGWTWRPEPSPEEYSDFCIKTATVIKESDPQAKVITGSHYQNSMEFFNSEFFNGVGKVSDAISYHSYDYDESVSIRRIKAFRALAKHYGKELEIIQGESGSQSKSGGNGAFGHIRTNQNMQTKYILRHSVAEILEGVKFTSVFSAVDMAENLDALADKPITTCGYFGLLGASFDPASGTLIGDYYEKSSYYAYQNLCSLFNENVMPVELPVIPKQQKSKRINSWDSAVRDIIYGAVCKSNGSKAFAYWKSTDLITCMGFDGSATFEFAGVPSPIHLVDPMDGGIYQLPDKILKEGKNGLYTFENLPLRDYPLILTFGDFFN